MVVAKSDGCIRLTCNYKNIDEQHNPNISASSGLRSSLRTGELKTAQHDGLGVVREQQQTDGSIRPSDISEELFSTASASGAF